MFVSQTPKEYGKINVIIELYLPGASQSLNHENFQDINDNWAGVLDQARQWAEQHLYPHQIAFFAVYEDEHSDANNDVRATIYYRGAANASLNVPADIKTPIYSSHLHVQGGDWRESYEWAQSKINDLGLQETKAVPATANKEEGNEKVVAIISWSRAVEDSLNQRQGGCCAIF